MEGYAPRKLNPAYITAFLIGASTLSVEIAFTRLLSVISYYHMAFFAISTAMLGMTAGAIRVFIQEKAFQYDRLFPNVGRACLGFSLSAVVSAIALCFIPVSVGTFIVKLMALLALTFFVPCLFIFRESSSLPCSHDPVSPFRVCMRSILSVLLSAAFLFWQD